MIDKPENSYKIRPVVKKIIKYRGPNELAGINQIKLLHFPQRPVAAYSDVEFVIQKNNGQGDIKVRLLCPSGQFKEIPLRIIDFDRLAVRFIVEEIGDYYVHVKYNAKAIPNSPFPLIVQEEYDQNSVTSRECVSDASQVKLLGMALKRIKLDRWNEFRVDASSAGEKRIRSNTNKSLQTNILQVLIFSWSASVDLWIRMKRPSFVTLEIVCMLLVITQLLQDHTSYL